MPSPCDSFWGKLTNPELCWSMGGLPLAASDAIVLGGNTMVNNPPTAPSTVGAMTVPGVWTPDYAMQRTWDDIQFEKDIQTAGMNTNNGPFNDPSGPDPSQGISWTTLLVGVAAVGVFTMVSQSGVKRRF